MYSFIQSQKNQNISIKSHRHLCKYLACVCRNWKGSSFVTFAQHSNVWMQIENYFFLHRNSIVFWKLADFHFIYRIIHTLGIGIFHKTTHFTISLMQMPVHFISKIVLLHIVWFAGGDKSGPTSQHNENEIHISRANAIRECH